MLVLEKTPLQIYSKRLVNLKFIQHIQLDLEQSEVNKLNTKISYLNQTYILHLTAYWQDFIERLANYAYTELSKEQAVSILNDALLRSKDNKIKKFNTPSNDKINLLFDETTGIVKITDCWNTVKFDNIPAKQKLNEILTSRHQIAHTGHTDNDLSYASNFKDMENLYELARLLQEKVDSVIKVNKF